VRITTLSVTPVKGFGLHHPERIQVGPRGVVGDRRFFMVDDDDRLLSVKRNGAFAGARAEYDDDQRTLSLRGDGLDLSGAVEVDRHVDADFFGKRVVSARAVLGPWSEALSDHAGERVRLVEAQEENAACDLEPMTLLGRGSLDRLTEQAGVALDPRRFRMNVEFTGADAHAEDEWEGQTIHVGTAVLRVGGPVKRCATITRNPDTGVADHPTLRDIKDYRGVQQAERGNGIYFGVYARVLRPGVIEVGDTVQLAAFDEAQV